MRKNSQQGIVHVALILIILLAAIAVWILVSKPWQAKSPVVQKSAQENQGQPQEIPKTNPFEVKTNPFKDVRTNPFD